MSFGDVVVYKSVEYVFLATTTEIVYLARILQPEESAFLIKRRDKVFMSTPSGANNRSNKLYCFTELSTAAFKNRVAHYGNSDGLDLEDFMDISGTLDTEDKKKLKGDIMSDDNVSQKLKELIQDIIFGA
ncbi:MAG: hypothetical protein A3C11_02865 [Candidatus Sungbacteria bacterium RIFCSPHIGHO2_02_FULL_49_12]|uniref:Uncharacterized protein n=1 Tax=Candidatus Sungbacteria bacterium RIFCSPHIGHO2_02_FULL_49_12 TaxID=1802271 RepID=A0A1G2KMF2_9BACT|nr:MAG: hypothetical protein A3C11_02865 [Candidatus Sungbacteria bacterium RIFCSPHIGHO2_02_FULL_49_12]